MIENSFCPGDDYTGTQLGDAVRFLDEHPGQIAFITINIGANDIFECQGDPACFIPQIAHGICRASSTRFAPTPGPTWRSSARTPTPPSSWTGSTTRQPASRSRSRR